MNWQSLELVKILGLVILAIGLHQWITRFGKNYATAIFQLTPEIGRNFLALADVAYFLIFAAYILFNVHFEKGKGWADQVNAAQLQDSVFSVAGICLIVGILHGINVFVLPIISSILALKERLLETPRH